MQKIKKPISILLSVLMVLSVFAVVPMSASATEWSGYVMGNELQAGDVLTSDVQNVMGLDGYTLTLVGGGHGSLWDVNNSDTVLNSFDINNSSECPTIVDTNEWETYFPYDGNGNSVDSWVVVAVDHDACTITLSGQGSSGSNPDPGIYPENCDVFNAGQDFRYEGEYYSFWAPNSPGYEPNQNGFYLVPGEEPLRLDRTEYGEEVYISAIEILRSSGEGAPVVNSSGNLVEPSQLDENLFVFTDLRGIDVQLTAVHAPLQVKRLVVYYEFGSAYTGDTYTVTWKDWDGTILETDSAEWGEGPVYSGTTPTRAESAEYTYNFAGWTNGAVTYGSTAEMPNVTDDVTYTAAYRETKRSYTVTWKNEDGSIIDITNVEYGETPTHANPTKAGDAQYTYTFLGWSPAVTAVTGSAEYTATFSAAVNEYTVTWKNGDEVLKTEDVAYGATPTYDGATPEKAEDENYTYTFAGWSPEITAVTGDVTYTAQYTATFKGITSDELYKGLVIDAGTPIKFLMMSTNQVYQGIELEVYLDDVQVKSLKVNPGSPTEPDRYYTPTKKCIVDSYTVQRGQTAIHTLYLKSLYDVTWKNGDEVLKTENVAYGATPTYDGETPTKPEDEQNTYTFAGWSPEITAVTGDVTYTATFTATPKTPAAGASYVKVTSEPDDWSGDYLIVYEDEDGSTAFNGSADEDELNSSGNYIDVTISGGEIESNAATDAAKVTIAQIDGGYSIATANGTYYIGGDSRSNKLDFRDEAILNTISLDNDGNAEIVSNTSTLRFNTTWDGFRYYRTVSQEPVQLYKLTGGSAPAPSVRLAGHTLSLEGDIGVNFYTLLSDDIANSATAYMHFTIPNGAKTSTQDILVSDARTVTIGDVTYHIFKCQVAAKEIDSQIRAQIIDGETVGEEYTYSVREYADYLLDNADENGTDAQKEYAAATPLVEKMMNYGEYANAYFGDSELADIENVEIPARFATFTSDLPDDAFVGATLSLRSQTSLSLYFNDTLSDVSCVDEKGTERTIESTTSGGYQVIRIRNIAAKELQYNYTVSVTINGTEYSISYSPMNYCYNVLNGGSDDAKLQNVVKALYLYAEAANEFFGEAPTLVENEVISSGFIEDFSTLNVGDYIANGVEYAADNDYKVVLTGGTYGTESRDGIVVRNGDYNFNAGEYGMGTYSYHVPQPNVFIEDYNENEKFYPAVDGVEGNAFVVVAKDDTQKIITIAGANVTQN